MKLIILVENSTVTVKNIKNNNCMKEIKVEQNDLDEIFSADNNNPNKKSKVHTLSKYY